jgi:hypothetical protein
MKEECRRFPPVPFLIRGPKGEPMPISMYPTQKPENVCGEFTAHVDTGKDA